MKQKILVADDEEMVRRHISRILGAMSYQVVTASDGARTLELAKTMGPDLIVLDVKMPGKSGWEVLRELRRQAGTRTIPVIMLTGCNDLCDEIEGRDLGADDYITKPFQVEDLRARVMCMLRRAQIDLSVNPLTRLPGSPSIEAEVDRRIAGKLPFAFLYADIDNFKPYNDFYGFVKGDGVLKATAQLLADSIRSADAKDAFLGHVGGDDFVVVVDLENAALVANFATTFFDRKVVTHYGPSDLSRGYIETADRQGRQQRFPLLTLSIGVVTTEHRTFDHYAQVVALATEMKAYCKSLPTEKLSRFAFDRRQGRKI